MKMVYGYDKNKDILPPQLECITKLIEKMTSEEHDNRPIIKEVK